MGVYGDRTSKNYADNIIDPLLSFNTSQTWSVSAGTGSASLDTDILFEGNSSLKLINTAPTTDLTVTNSVQSTSIAFSGDYRHSFYIRKDEADEFMTVEVACFQNAVLFNTQTYVLGSETTEDDRNGYFVRFVSDVDYNFTKGDNITFTFTLKGKAGTALLNTTVWLDGMHLEPVVTNELMPSLFKKPLDGIDVELLKGVHGWGFYQDAETTPATQTFNTTYSKLQIDGAGANSNTSYLPLQIRGISQLWDVASDKIIPINLGDSYEIRLDIEVDSETGSPTEITIQLDIGGDVTPTIPIVTRFAAAGKSVPYNINVGFPIFCLSTFITNGGQFFVKTDSGSVTVGARSITIIRLSSGLI